MIAYHCTGPQGTRFSGVRLRLVVYTPHRGPATGKLKCVLQAMKARTPIAEDPILVDYLTPLELLQAMSDSRWEGWTFEFDYALAAMLERERPGIPSKKGCIQRRVLPIHKGRHPSSSGTPRLTA